MGQRLAVNSFTVLHNIIVLFEAGGVKIFDALHEITGLKTTSRPKKPSLFCGAVERGLLSELFRAVR